MTCPLFSVPAQINKHFSIETLMDDGCNSYALVDRRTVRKAGLPVITLGRTINASSFSEQAAGEITQVAILESLDIAGSVSAGSRDTGRVFAYIVPKIVGRHGIILGKPWRLAEKAWIDPTTDTLHIGRTGVSVSNEGVKEATEYLGARVNLCELLAPAFATAARMKGAQIFSVTMADIEKALRVKEKIDPRIKLPPRYLSLVEVFSQQEADKLPPHRPGVDHHIDFELQDGKEPSLPRKPLYNMSREMLLVLRKTLTELLEKGFIRVSSSSAAAPVLFVKKPGGGLRFCVDYRALNEITRKDRYPLPLIRETLRALSRAKWFTKLDVIAAFNKMRIAAGDEYKTAFTTRFGLFEWLVCPFGLANAPSSFQRWINSLLQEWLDDFVTAYLDDILIYTSGSREDHEMKVHEVLQRLKDNGIQLDINKCEFSVKKVKYLGFIVAAEVGIEMDPEKVKAIMMWERPTTVRGVRSFIGFANFYRSFIRDYSGIVAPLTDLTKKENQLSKKNFALTPPAIASFEYLKRAFVSAPILLNYDPEKEAIIECDASGYVTGGTLMQYDDAGVLRPVAFMSKKMSPAECNYEIYDKEMLAIIRCAEEWDDLLRPIKFTVRTDHRNLGYYKEVQKLTERQIRWMQTLSRYTFKLEYKPGKLNVLADALSRRDQDMPQGDEDDRIKARSLQFLKPHQYDGIPTVSVIIAKVLACTNEIEISPDNSLQELWDQSMDIDETYGRLVEVARQQGRQLPPDLKLLRISPADLSLTGRHLRYRSRFWVPDHEPLRTKLLQETHDGYLTGHPGKNLMIGIISRQYFWPGMANDVRTFVRNCKACGRNTVWRDRKQGLLQPLPVPEQVWSEISMDYITELPKTERRFENILVITDRLSKGVIFIPVADLSAETLAQVMIEKYVAYHLLPSAIVSDRGASFVNGVWACLCKLLNVKQRLSTAYHPETDGSTERMNQTLEEYLRHYCTYYQTNWDQLLPLAQAAINARDATSIGMSPFFLTHGYHPRTGSGIALPNDLPEVSRSPAEGAQQIVQKLRHCSDLAQSVMAHAQQRQQEIADRKRDPAPSYKVGDRVWLDRRNIKVAPLRKKKLSALHDQYNIVDVIGPNACRLDTEGSLHNVFHNTLLRPVAHDPFPSQVIDDTRPEPIEMDGDEPMYGLDEILDVQVIKQASGRRTNLVRQFLCKWEGWAQPTWNIEEFCQGTEALNRFEARLGRNFSTERLREHPPLSSAPPKRRSRLRR